MKNCILLICCLGIFVSGIFAQEVKPLDWEEINKSQAFKATEVWEPVPEKVTPAPAYFAPPPSDAIVLFDGTDLSSWQTPKYGYGARMDNVEEIIEVKKKYPSFSEPKWVVKDGSMTVKAGSGAIESKQAFGDIQLHIEWLSPVMPGRADQGYGNSGVFLMGLYEVQVLNSYENITYPNGQAGALYKQSIPMVNASRPPGEWQAYDIVFNAPVFDDENELIKPAFITVFHNGVLIQNHFQIQGPCVYLGKPYYTPHDAKLPLLLQDHGDPVRFRNIWVREL